MHTHDAGGRQTQPVREGIVARSTIRFVAGVGAAAASLLIVGPVSATAVADEGGSGSHSSRDDRGLWNRGGKDDHRGRSNLPEVELGGPDLDGPAMRVGAGRTGQEGLRAPENLTIAERSAAEPPVQESGPFTRSGSDLGRAPTASIRSPRVVVGNGRPPVVRHREEQPQRELPAFAPEVAPAAPERVVVDVPPPPPVDRGQPPRLVPKLGVAESTSSTDPLFGLAGLVLIPAVGAALGYRQARAAHGAARSGRP
jgi:hypothetical protein